MDAVHWKPVNLISLPKPRWRCYMTPGPFGTVLHLENAPNAFHRFMQRLAFGFRWERLP